MKFSERQAQRTLEEVVIYRALYGESELWVRPLSMWNDIVEHNDVVQNDSHT
jgi:hypothetical protein